MKPRRERAKGATFFEATEGETARPMLDVAWAPMMGAFSVLFEEYNDSTVVNLCLQARLIPYLISPRFVLDVLCS